MIDQERALHLLMSKYRYDEAMRLFGEFCLLMEEDWNEFVGRHTPLALRQLHRQLGAVGLWPPELIPPSQGTGLLAQTKKAITGMLTGMLPAAGGPGAPQAQLVEPDGGRSALVAAGRDPDKVLSSLLSLPLSIDLSPNLLAAPAVGAAESPLHDAIALIRYQLAHDLGFVFPLIELKGNVELSAGVYSIRMHGETVAEGRLQEEGVAAVGAALNPEWATGTHPVRGIPIAWMTEAAGRAYEGETQAPHALLAEHVEETVRRYAHRLLTNQALELLLRAYEPQIGKETLAELLGRFMSLSELRLVLQAMLKGGYTVRNLPRIVDILMNHFINYLASKPLSMDETWKISSHIPFFATEELTRVVCQGLGLPSAGDRRTAIAERLEWTLRDFPPSIEGQHAHRPGLE